MARALEFDQDQALTSAMAVFRRLGYAGVSIKALEAETGLSSGSIYNSFGSKEALFARAVVHYNQIVVRQRLLTHLQGKPAFAGLASLFESLLDEPGGKAFGCLLTNSAIEFAGQETEASAALRAGFDLLQTGFTEALLTLPQMTQPDAERGALRLLAFYQGLLVLIRNGHDKEALRATIPPELKAITGENDA
ncbi:TetR/AcrR family transcriptional regulator [Tritonibacter mobilis]|uniref:TetR/AcrR family transcriptional regulator n=1 Tax=Tritonibacter mobilis TaxID=379347 RepID=UPI001C08E8F3|nr:TetR/AcrR family transcriptional regulator [Tritonibacter mobilis]MBU3033995.1 TetR/AcrR family transcriptional regulator [Tritonibacter mobilis]WHQ85036.1 TetR/AcrR family transcriptional regulator [Tritonibacter mobilis]